VLVIDDRPVEVMHPVQAATALGLPVPPRERTKQLAWDIHTLFEAWRRTIAALTWETLMLPTPSRGRTLRNLHVNVSRPIALLPTALRQRHFDWHPEPGHPDSDDEIERTLGSLEDASAFADEIASGYMLFLMEAEEELETQDPVVRTSHHGALPFSALLEHQRAHVAFHFRQMDVFLEREGIEVGERFALESIPGLTLPERVY
jgi:hypothetical protein